MATHLLLFHELCVRAVVDNILSEDRRGQDGVDVLGRDVLELAVQDEVITIGSNIDGGLPAEENEGEDVAILSTHGVEERRRIHAICNGTPDNGEPVKDEGRLIWILEQDLVQDIENDAESNKAEDSNSHLRQDRKA